MKVGKVDVLAVMERDAKAASLQRWSDRVPNETLHLMQMDQDAKEARAAVAELIAERDALLDALRQISLCSVNSASSKDECGRIARAALARIGGAA